MKTAQELRRPIHRGPVRGSLVRTRRVWPGGIHRAEVESVSEVGGTRWIHVCGMDYRASELEVIRPPVE